MIKQYYRQILITLLVVTGLVAAVLVAATISAQYYYESVNRKTIEQIKNIVDMRVEETHNIAFQMYSSPKLPPVSQTDDIFSKSSLGALLEYQRSLENFGFYNQCVLLNFTVILQNQYVVLPSSGQDLQSFSKNFFNEKYPLGLDAVSFLKLIENEDFSFSEKIWYKQTDSGTVVETIPYVKWHRSSGNQKNVAVVVLLDITQINQLLRQSLTTDRSAFCILDNRNQLIASSRELSAEEFAQATQLVLQENDGVRLSDNHMGYSRTAQNSQWNYVLLADQKESIDAFDVLMILLILICAVCFLAVIGGSLAIIHRNQRILKPIIEMTGAKPEVSKNQNAYQVLSRNIQKMMDDQTRLDKRVKEQNAVIREVYLNNFLRGDTYDCNSRPITLEELGVCQKNAFYAVAILSLNDTGSMDFSGLDLQKVKSMIAESVRLYSKDILSCNISQMEVAFIFSLHGQKEEAFQSQIEIFYRSLDSILQEQFGIQITFSVGGIHTGDNALPVSYSEARLNSNLLPGSSQKRISWYSGASKQTNSYYYPQETEIQLINAIRSGNRVLVENIVQDLFEVNLRKKQVDYDYLVAFLHEFYSALLKVLKTSDIDQELQQEIFHFFADNVRNIDSMGFQQQFFKYVYLLTDSFQSGKKSHNQLLAQQIMDFVEENYGDYNLTLYRVADEFHLSSGYLSAFFREQTGATFSEYLLSIKMEKAKDLLINTAEHTNTIAKKVGYGSSNTFCRAFRKFYGISPSEMRNCGNGASKKQQDERKKF